MRAAIILLAAGLVAAAGSGVLRAVDAPTLAAGETAYVALNFDDARAAYTAAGARAADPKERAAALRQLGVMAWRLEDRPAKAERFFAQARAVGARVCGTEIAAARFLAAKGRFKDAIAASDAAVAAASDAAEHMAAALSYARSVLAALAKTDLAEQTDADLALLARARGLIAPYAGDPPMTLELSDALLEIAVRSGDGALAWTAWSSYAREGARTGAWAEAARLLGRALPDWKGGASGAARADIVEGLRQSQFFALAALVVRDSRAGDRHDFASGARVRETIAYADFIARIREATDIYYRAVANGRGDAKRWTAALQAAGREVWPQLDLGEARAYSDDALQAELKARFGAYISIGETSGVEDLHYGHVFIDDPRTIEQYGHKAVLRRVAIDRMVDNGYESWIWDGRQAHGGWARTDHVVQVRPGYADGGLREWQRLTDPTLRAAHEADIAKASAGDDAIAARDSAAYLPGLALRIVWQGKNALLERLRRTTPPGELKARFVVEYGRIDLDANFFAHEGRHALDKIAFDGTAQEMSGEELEYRAKLSEIAFSEEPRLSWGSIINPSIGADTPHGRANKRIMKGLVAWMEAHRAAIVGLEPARPLLPQLDKLSDDQMRDAMRAMDPWAPKS